MQAPEWTGGWCLGPRRVPSPERQASQREPEAMCRAGCSHGEKQNNTAPSPDTHSWPGRCKNSQAAGLEVVTERGLQL